ncbi:MAG: hypothetical protein QOG70_513, partial [Solirubrobacteraceae bacterium]|nr:hypothetical protein [Solirubrobacteraceae bacterium]
RIDVRDAAHDDRHVAQPTPQSFLNSVL